MGKWKKLDEELVREIANSMPLEHDITYIEINKKLNNYLNYLDIKEKIKTGAIKS